MSVNWEITRGCNLSCIYCRVYGGKPRKDELTLKEAKQVIRQLSRIGYEHIKFTGGEPLLREDFWDLVKFAHRQRMMTSLITNGTLITEGNLPLFRKYIFMTAVSLDSLDLQISSNLQRGSNPGLIVQNIKKLVTTVLHVKINVTVSKLNIKEIPRVLQLAKELKVEEIRINDVVINGRARKHKELLKLPKPLIWKSKKLKGLVQEILGENPKLVRQYKCECGNNNLFITYKGDVYPCVELSFLSKSFCLGNILEGRLGKILTTNQKFYTQIKTSDYCRYGYMYSPHFSACLNRGCCPLPLKDYMKNAKNGE